MSKAPTKAEEIEILTKTAKRLEGGYTGRWLAAQIPSLTNELTSDFPAGSWALTPEEFAKSLSDRVRNAKTEAEDIKQRAVDEAARIVAAANQRANDLLGRAHRNLTAALNELK